MFQHVKNSIYELIVWSGIINFMIPLLKPLFLPMFRLLFLKSGYVVKDKLDVKLNATWLTKTLCPPFMEENTPRIRDFKIRKTDVLLCGYPKTGCHWAHEILHMLVTGKAELTKHGKVMAGMIDLMPPIFLDSLPSPRVLNSHLLYDQLPKGIKENRTKIVFTARNPKDTVVSFFNHHKTVKAIFSYDGQFDGYFDLFMAGQLVYGSYFDYMLSWDKVMQDQKNNSILLMTFEEMKKDPKACVFKMAKFLDIDITDSFAAAVVEASDFKKMKDRRECEGGEQGKIFRKGTVGDWKNWFTDAQSEAMDRVWRERMTECLYQPRY